MKNNNQLAGAGLRRVFTSQILMIVAIVLSVVLEIMAKVKGEIGGATLALGIVALVCMVVAFIMNIMGLYKASPAHSFLKSAFYITIFSLILSVIGQIPGLESFAQHAGIAQVVIDATMVYLVCFGAGALLKAKGDNGTANLGKVTVILYVICAIVIDVCNWSKLTATSPIALSLLVIMLVCQAAGKLLYLIFLGKASSSLVRE